MTSLQMGFIDQYLLNNNNNNNNNKKQKEKRECLGMLIPKPTTSTSNGKYQLLTCMLQAPCMLGGLMLIPIFVTFFMSSIQSSPMALRAQFMYYIIFYSFKHGRNPCDIFEEIEEVWFGGYELIHFEPFA